jgi:hypothetical protein
MFIVAAPVICCQTADAQYAGWQHSGSLYVLTTPQGADLPANVSDCYGLATVGSYMGLTAMLRTWIVSSSCPHWNVMRIL